MGYCQQRPTVNEPYRQILSSDFSTKIYRKTASTFPLHTLLFKPRSVIWSKESRGCSPPIVQPKIVQCNTGVHYIQLRQLTKKKNQYESNEKEDDQFAFLMINSEFLICTSLSCTGQGLLWCLFQLCSCTKSEKKPQNPKPQQKQLASYLLGIVYNVSLLTICYCISCELVSHKHISQQR